MSRSAFSIKAAAAAPGIAATQVNNGSAPSTVVYYIAAEAHRAAARNDRAEALQLANPVARTELAPPRTLPQLLRTLGVNDEPVTTQWRAIMAWLADNQLTPRLWMSMLANGYGVIIERTTPGFHRPIPYRRIITASGTKAQMLI